MSRKRNRKKNWSLRTMCRNLQPMDSNRLKKNNKENNNDEWNSTIQHQLPSRSSPPLGRWKTRRRTLWRTGHVLARRRSGHVRAAGGGKPDSRTRDPGARSLRDLQGRTAGRKQALDRVAREKDRGTAASGTVWKRFGSRGVCSEQ